MKNLNRITLIGTIGGEPVVRTVNQNGSLVARVSLATNEYRKNKTTGRYEQYDTQWHSLVLWDSLALLAQRYLHKGMEVYAEGKICYRQYTDKTGIEKEKAEVIVSDVFFKNSAIHNTSRNRSEAFENDEINQLENFANIFDDNMKPEYPKRDEKDEQRKLLEGSVPENTDEWFPF